MASIFRRMCTTVVNKILLIKIQYSNVYNTASLQPHSNGTTVQQEGKRRRIYQTPSD